MLENNLYPASMLLLKSMIKNSVRVLTLHLMHMSDGHSNAIFCRH
jgi:hypothetical protein